MRNAGGMNETDPGFDPLVSLMFLILLKCEVSHRRLYELTQRSVLRAILRINRNRDDAAEIMQDVYVAVWDKAAKYDPLKAKVMAWLITIAQRKAVSSLRRRSSRLRSTSDMASRDHDPHEHITISNHLEPFAALVKSQTAKALHLSVNALPPDQCRSVTMCYFEDMTHAEIAEQTGKPLGTVKAWIRRSMQAMRPSLAGY